ncbi:MAG: 3'-5' exonuclease, partial [Myxococcota bacterium]
LPEVVAADISRLLASGATVTEGGHERPLHAGDIAVLVRKNAQAMLVNKALRALAIPGVVYGDATVFETREAAELSRILAAVAEPTATGRLRAAITTELFGVTAEALQTMAQPGEEADLAWAGWVDDFRRWHAIWVDRGFVQMFRALIASRGVQRRTLAMLDGERRMTNLLHLAELLHTAAKTEHLGPSGLLTWLAHERARRQNYAEAVKLRLERDDRAVQLVTIHRSKGLEYPVVYCPWLWDGTQLFDDEEEFLLWHDPAQDHRAQLDVRLKAPDRRERGNDPSIASARRERAAENLRLLYVAVTRARHRCVVAWGPFYRFFASPLGYLLHSPELDERWPWDPAQIEAKIKDADDTKLSNWLRERAGEDWNVQRMHVGEAVVYRGDEAMPANLSCRPCPGGIDDGVRTTSFSQLATAAQSRPRATADAGRDHDELSLQSPHGQPAPTNAGPPVALADFPRGAKAGNFVHGVLEQLDFGDDGPTIAAVVSDRLDAHGFAPDRWTATVSTALHDVLRTPIMDDGPRLVDITADRRLVEMEFLLPLAGGTHPSPSTVAGTRAAMARLFARHPEGLPSGYAERLGGLSFAPLRGFLKGFIDLIFEYDGRWYVVDYKTNHLGDTADDYTPSRLSEVMGHDHYVLQYHLYTVALVRHLRRHRPDFDYERDFGGAAYLFVRGMSAQTGASRGVFFERPPKARIDGLTALLLEGTPR